jgi:hypothetical protein
VKDTTRWQTSEGSAVSEGFPRELFSFGRIFPGRSRSGPFFGAVQRRSTPSIGKPISLFRKALQCGPIPELAPVAVKHIREGTRKLAPWQRGRKP